MFRFKREILAAMAAWVVTSAGLTIPVSDDGVGAICPRGDADFAKLGQQLSSTAQIFFPGSTEFTLATTRWSNLDTPTVNVVVVAGTANDVSLTIKYANKKNIPFLAYNGVHGAITTLGRMTHGIDIDLSQLSGVEVAEDGQTATIAGGTMSKNVTDALWAAGKQTVTGTCECVSYLGPALGGGHGWLQGHHGLVSDQFVSLDIVLANGTLITVDETSDLWWALKGAGHNFGIVTSATTKIYDIEYSNWAIETLIFTGDKVEAIYEAANEYILKNGTQPADIINWSYWLNDVSTDPDKPIILFYIIQEGVDAVDTAYTEPFHNIGPLVAQPVSGTYLDLAGWTGIALDSPPCQKNGQVNPRFPIYVKSYNTTAQRQAYDLFAAGTAAGSPFNGSLFMFEGYSHGGVEALGYNASAFAFREDPLLFAPLITYTPNGTEVDAAAAKLGNELRQIILDGSGDSELHAYVNYAYGDETPEDWYGHEEWRQARLQTLKTKYDPLSKFSFYAPITG